MNLLQAFRWDAHRPHHRGSGVFIRLFCSFLAMLVIPVAIIAIDYYRYKAILKRETLGYQTALLVQTQQVTDERLETICLTAIELSMDNGIDSYLSDVSADQADINFSGLQITNTLRQYWIGCRSVENIFLYSIRHGRVLTPSTVYSGPLDQFALLDDDELNKGLTEWFQKERLYCLFVTLPTAQAGNGLFLLQSVPLWSTGRTTQGVIAMYVDTETLLQEVYDTLSPQGGLICLLDGSGAVLAAAGDSSLQEYLAELPPEEQSIWNGWAVSRVASRLNGWQYVLVQPLQGLSDELRKVLYTQFLFLGVVGLVGVGAAYLLSRRNYSPLERLVKRMKQDYLYGPFEHAGSEYELIEETLGSVTRCIAEVQDKLGQELPRIQENMIHQLLVGMVEDYARYGQALAEIGVLMPYGQFLVVVLQVIAYPSDRVEEQEMFKLLLREQASQAMPASISYSMSEIGPDTVALLLNGEQPGLEQCALQAMERLENRARTELMLNLVLCISNTVDGLGQVSSAYYLARRQAEQMRAAGRIGVARIEKNSGADRILSCPEDLKLQITNLASVGDQEKVGLLLKEAYQATIAGRQAEPSMLHSYFITLITTLLDGLPTKDERFDAFWGEHNPVPRLLAGKQPEEMQQIVVDFSAAACTFVKETRMGHAEAQKKALLAYLRDHHADCNLSLTSVAAHFRLTSTYLSTFFKENMGDTFLSALTKIRVEHAKQLLAQTNDTVAEIAVCVGYINSNALIRNYKKIEGLTPGEYRDILRQQQ